MRTCKKCNCQFVPVKGLKDYCSLKCRNSRSWTEKDRLKKSTSAKNSEKVLIANRSIERRRGPRLKRVESMCLMCNKPIVHTVNVTRKYHAECWLKSSGGLRPGSTKKHRSEYNGQMMDSGAEKAFAMKCDELNIAWKKNSTVYFEYVDKVGKVRKYYPDFYLPKFNKWVEVKGKLYQDMDENFDAKMKAVDNISLVYSTDINHFSGF
jgi:hypothetical protein